jgi:hypothetical protein
MSGKRNFASGVAEKEIEREMRTEEEEEEE